MKGAENFLAVYVPKALVGQNLGVIIRDGCDTTAADRPLGRNTFGFTATTYFDIYTTSRASVALNNPNSDNVGCPNNASNGTTDLVMFFNANASTYTDGNYLVYVFVGAAVHPQPDGWSWYVNNYRVESVPASGILIGMMSEPPALPDGSIPSSGIGCNGNNPAGFPYWPYSCPSTQKSFSTISAWDGSNLPYEVALAVAATCTSPIGLNGTVRIYDPDNSPPDKVGYQKTMMFNLTIIDRTTKAVKAVLTPPGGKLVDGGNDDTWFFPGGNNNGPPSGPTFSYTSSDIILATITGIGDINSLQILLSGSHGSASQVCVAPDNTPPVISAVTDCNAGTLTVTATDADSPGTAVPVALAPAAPFSSSPSYDKKIYSMRGYDAGGPVAFNISTQGLDTAGAAGTLPAVTTSATYTPCPTLINITTFVSLPVLLADAEAPTSANFGGDGFNVSQPVPATAIPVPSATVCYRFITNAATVINPTTNICALGSNMGSGVTVIAGAPGITASNALPAGVKVGDRVCTTVVASPSWYKIRTDNSIVSTGPATAASTVCARVVNRPYTRFYGNDIASGTAYVGSCSGPATPASIIDVFSRPNGVGSATQLGAIADGSINGLATMALTDALTGNLYDRAFANTNLSGSIPAGAFGATNCAYNFPVPASVSSVTVANYSSGSGANVLSGAGNQALPGLANFTGSMALYYIGNISITGNVNYGASGPKGGPWSAGNVPSFTLIVTGNIYIQPGVTQLDGIYIAKPTAGNPTKTGRIYTCANNYAAATTAMMQLGGPCSTNQLVINGSFLAKHINFLRTKGTLRSAVAGEAYGAPSFATNIAEVFRYSPESYMTTPGVQAYDDSTNYDSVLSLSPSL